MTKKVEYKLDELSEKTGIPPRTIRLYISRGLLMAPLRSGRDAAYGREHIERLRAIRDLQRRGLTLEEIKFELAGGKPQALPEPSLLTAFKISDDITVLVSNNLPPWRIRQIRKAIDYMVETLSNNGGKDE